MPPIAKFQCRILRNFSETERPKADPAVINTKYQIFERLA